MSLNERDLFIAALQRSPAERLVFLDRACGGDPSLKSRVVTLLQAHEMAGGLLDLLPTDPEPTSGPTDSPEVATVTATATDEVRVARPGDSPRLTAATETGTTLGYASEQGPTSDRSALRSITEGPGTRIGRYKLLQELGAGAMGSVYMAEQENPVRRRVALKIIKPGMDSDQVIARFEAERQALALMEHPGIAKVFDAGTTETGRPFFVMELVKGVPITQFCDEAHLSPRERLELFVQVCQAIQHAHQKGIIHRDIKPSNVLVTTIDGAAAPKVIDFGVAKAIDQRLTERTLFTQFGVIIGTPEYMSPEQAEVSGLDIDTRSDVYSLGVLLYELLTGSTPLDQKAMRKAAFAEILKRIREEEPPKPSTRLSSSGARLPSIAAQRRSEPIQLTRLVRGDLDWIVMKALEKTRSRRYETANDFARDVERYLSSDPVEACPPSVFYKLRKFASKHRGLIATASAFVILLVIGIVVSVTLAIRALRAERYANEQRDRAVRAEGRALKLAEDAIEFNRRILGSAHPGTLDAMVTLAEMYEARGRHDEAERMFESALDGRRKLLGPTHPETLKLMSILEVMYRARGRLSKADPLAAELLQVQRHIERRRLGAADAQVAEAMALMAGVLMMQQKYAEAEPILRDCLAIHHAQRHDNWFVFKFRSLLGESLLCQKRYAEAEHLILDGYKGLKDREAVIPRPEKVCLSEAGERVVRLYESWGKFSKAVEWRKRLGVGSELPAGPFRR